MTVSLDEMPNQGEVKVSPERSGRVVDPNLNPSRVLSELFDVITNKIKRRIYISQWSNPS
jgi:hypothetical protein